MMIECWRRDVSGVRFEVRWFEVSGLGLMEGVGVWWCCLGFVVAGDVGRPRSIKSALNTQQQV